MNILTLRDVIKELERKKGEKSLLLGNGFTCSLFPEFRWDSLTEEVKKDLKNNKQLKEFIGSSARKTNSDLEQFLYYFQEGGESINFFNSPEYMCCEKFSKVGQKLLSDGKELRKIILETIKRIHPKNSEGKRLQFDKCGKILGKFNYIFTINYDLILYWLINHCRNKLEITKFTDGMWNIDKNRKEEFKLNQWDFMAKDYSVHFLHGALQLLEEIENKNTLKLVSGDDNILSIIERLEQNEYLERYENLIVLEGSADSKQKYIYKHEYLKENLERLRTKNGSLVVYGCSIVDGDFKINNDEHIWRAIMNSKFDSIYIGIHQENEEFQKYKKKIKEGLESLQFGSNKKEVKFFTTMDPKESIWLLDLV